MKASRAPTPKNVRIMLSYKETKLAMKWFQKLPTLDLVKIGISSGDEKHFVLYRTIDDKIQVVYQTNSYTKDWEGNIRDYNQLKLSECTSEDFSESEGSEEYVSDR